jgi:hypothetical protein
MFIGDDSARRFDRVECDLSDVLGTPGVARADEVAGRFGQSLDVRFEAFPADPGLFLRSVGVVGAFPSPLTALTETAGAFDDALAMTTTARTRSRRRPAQETGTRVVSKVASPSALHELYVQTMDGRRVIGGSYRVHAGRTGGEVRVSVTGAPIGDLDQRDPGPPPDPRRADVRAAMRDQLGLHRGVKLRLETVLFPLDGTAVWAYLGRGIYRDEDTAADLRIIVKADDLQLLVSRDAAVSAQLGEAHVFDSNPARDPNTRVVRLPDLTGAELRSEMIDVGPSNGGRPLRELRDWRVAVNDAEFDDVSAYYHLSRAANWFASLIGPGLFTKAPFRPLTVITGVRAARGAVGRFFSTKGLIEFGDGDTPGARSADICIHEFTHAVVYAAHGIDELSTVQARGLSEGYADYAQASLLDNPLFGDWVAGPKYQRDCSSAALRFPADLVHAPNDDFTIYKIGSAWAAVLWEIRQEIGADVADVLAFDSIFYLDGISSVASAHTALLECDARLFPADDRTGRHTEVIENAFSRRMP